MNKRVGKLSLVLAILVTCMLTSLGCSGDKSQTVQLVYKGQVDAALPVGDSQNGYRFIVVVTNGTIYTDKNKSLWIMDNGRLSILTTYFPSNTVVQSTLEKGYYYFYYIDDSILKYQGKNIGYLLSRTPVTDWSTLDGVLR